MDRVVELDREPMSRRHAVAEVKVHSQGDEDAFPPLSERVRKGVGRSVRACFGPLDFSLILENASDRKAHLVGDVVGALHSEVELVTQAVPPPVVHDADHGIDLDSDRGHLILNLERSAGQDVRATGASLHRKG